MKSVEKNMEKASKPLPAKPSTYVSIERLDLDTLCEVLELDGLLFFDMTQIIGAVKHLINERNKYRDKVLELIMKEVG